MKNGIVIEAIPFFHFYLFNYLGSTGLNPYIA